MGRRRTPQEKKTLVYKTPYARQLAIFLNDLLPDPLPHSWPTPRNGRRDMNRAWLAAFLADYPDWEQRVRWWIAQRLAAR
jgi:hypothetical protein